MDFREEADEILEASPQAIHRPGHHHVELASGRRFVESIELRSLVFALGPRDAVILVDRDGPRARLDRDRPAGPDPDADAVLVSVDSMAALRRAYPNYFLDTKVFVDLMNETLKSTRGPPKRGGAQLSLFREE
jgi:hypothetical protein